MIEAPQITRTTDQLTAILHVTVRRAEIQNVMGPGIHEVLAAVADQGLAPCGPWFTHHLRRPTDTFDFEICVPVPAPVTATGHVQPGLWPAMSVARTVYHGGDEGLGAAWGEFLEWVAAGGHAHGPNLWRAICQGQKRVPTRRVGARN